MFALRSYLLYTMRMENTLLSKEHFAAIQSWLGSGSLNIFGLPFAGKDTHGETLAKLFNAPLLGGGDILRNSVIPPHVKEEIDAGRLAPTDEFIKIITPYLSSELFVGRPLILSSVGRWLGEEEGIIGATEASGHPIKAAIYLHLSEEVVYKRYKKSLEKGDRTGRADDVEHKLATRIQEFNQKTLPVIEVYRQKGLLIEINSDAPKNEVEESILARLLVQATSHA
jgi:adenylate kinase